MIKKNNRGAMWWYGVDYGKFKINFLLKKTRDINEIDKH